MNPHPDDHELLSPAGDERRRDILATALGAADRRRHMRVARRIGAIACVAGLLVGAFVTMTRSNHRGVDAKMVTTEKPRSPQSNPAGGEATSHPAPKSPAPQYAVRGDDPSERHPPPVAPRPHTTQKSHTIVVQIIPAGQVDRRWETLTDDQLLATLADAGHPSGIVRLNGKAILVPVQ